MDWTIWAIVPGLITLVLLVGLSIWLKSNRRYLWGGAGISVALGLMFWLWDETFGDAQGLAEAIIAGSIAVAGAIYGTRYGAKMVFAEQERVDERTRLRSDLIQLEAALAATQDALSEFVNPEGNPNGKKLRFLACVTRMMPLTVRTGDHQLYRMSVQFIELYNLKNVDENVLKDPTAVGELFSFLNKMLVRVTDVYKNGISPENKWMPKYQTESVRQSQDGQTSKNDKSPTQ